MVSEGTAPETIRLFEQDDPIVGPIVKAHQAHSAAMEAVARELEQRGVDATWCHDLAGTDPDDYDLVITVGGDGTVLHASHSIDDTPVLAVNSSPHTSYGYFTAAGIDGFGPLLEQAIDGTLEPILLYRMTVSVNGETVNDRVLNDVLFSHDCPASTTRYEISSRGVRESQLSSGVWVSTAAGSTAAIRAAGGEVIPAGSGVLQFVVREPGPSGGAAETVRPRLVQGLIQPGETLQIRSRTAAARLYVDGPHVVFPVDFGDVVTFAGSAKPLKLLGYRLQNLT
jgi:NAD+ kinase